MTELEDRAAIQDLALDYAHFVDSDDGAALAALFAGDGSIRVFAMRRPEPLVVFDRESGIAGMGDVIARTYAATLHTVGNHRIALAGDRATGTAYCLAHHFFEHDGETRAELLPVRYEDEYVRVDGAWRFARRDIHRLWTEVTPAARKPLTVDLVAAGRITL